MAESLRMNKKDLSDEERVRTLQRKLYQKAKQEVNFRFYVLYDKIRIPYVLRHAYALCRKKKGAPGIDGVTFDMIEEQGVADYLSGIRKELEEKTYKPQMVKRVYIPKPNGKQRPLGIPCIKDRIVQRACKLIIEPIFEADFEDESYGFRPKRSAGQAVTKIRDNLREGYDQVYDADLSAYFDTIPHKELMYLIELRISDKNVLKLIRMWLKAQVWEDGKVSGGKKNRRGTPQGGVISPLLANIYLNLLDKAVNRVGGVFQRTGIKIVRYADDFILMGKMLSDEVLDYLQGMLSRLKLEINQDKSRVVNAMESDFDFLGFNFRWSKGRYGYNDYWNITPGKKAVSSYKLKIRNCLFANRLEGPNVVVRELNWITRGWLNYYRIPKVSYPRKARQNVRNYMMERLSRFYYRKSQRKSKMYKKGAFKVLNERFGLLSP